MHMYVIKVEDELLTFNRMIMMWLFMRAVVVGDLF